MVISNATAPSALHMFISHALASASLVTNGPRHPPYSNAIVDSGATDHMWPDHTAFTSYRPLHNNHITIAEDSTKPAMGISSIKISIGGQVVDIRNVLHVPGLCMPLYSLRAHRRMPGCGFLGDNSTFHVYFPTFITDVDDTIDLFIKCTTLG